MSILITGGTGFIGSGIARTLVEKGEDVVLFDIAPRIEKVADIQNKVKIIQGDLKVWPEVLNAVRDNNVKGIFHLGAMLSVPSENNPWASFQTNIAGMTHVLEAARLFGVERVVFTSSGGTFGLGAVGVITDETLQRPITMYGTGKLFGELLGRFYRRKFNLDFRCIRYNSIMGPGVKTMAVSQFTSWMIESAALGKPFECFVTEEVALPITYFKDAIRATVMLYEAPPAQIKMICYNIGGVPELQPARNIELAIKKFIPDAKITYKPDPQVMEIFRPAKRTAVDDSRARAEWGWQPRYTDLESVVSDFIQEVKTRPHLYGLA